MSTRVRGLDALRFLCALCVVQGHLRLGGYLVLDHLREPRDLVRIVRIAFNQGIPIPTGPNAVIVFFVISGFCIHAPYVSAKQLDVRQFIGRRYIRIGLPALVAAFLLHHSGFDSLQDSVLWSIICEAIYYGLYPLLMPVKDRIGWPALLGGAYLAAYLVVAWQSGGRYNGNFTAFGVWLTWILGLPCWLLGCVLAETYQRFRACGRARQWLIRAGIIAAAGGVTTLRFYAGVGYHWTQPALAILIYGWLGTEIAYFRARKPWQWLERCGSWSYSLYLFHAPIAIHTGAIVGLYLERPSTLLVELGAIVAGCYLLYLGVERPAHLLARRYAAAAREVRLAA